MYSTYSVLNESKTVEVNLVTLLYICTMLVVLKQSDLKKLHSIIAYCTTKNSFVRFRFTATQKKKTELTVTYSILSELL